MRTIVIPLPYRYGSAVWDAAIRLKELRAGY